MRLLPRRWDYETLICAFRGHATPAASVRELRAQDRPLGVDLADGTRMVRCVRCDAWRHLGPDDNRDRGVDGEAPLHLAPLEELHLPRRGRALEDAVVLRLIAILRGLHFVAFTILAVGLGLLMTNLSTVQTIGQNMAESMDSAVAHTGQQASRSLLSDMLHDIGGLQSHTLKVLFVTAVVYAVVEGIEAVGLWRERRWAEYLTALATAGFLPFEIHELAAKVSVLRVGTLVVNVAILVWLVYSKRLFGLRGGTVALQAAARTESLDQLAALRTGDVAAPSP